MVRQTYVGLGPPEQAVREFDALRPYVVELLGLQAECLPRGPDHMAVGIALDGLQTTAYHFTRRRRFYDIAVERRPEGGLGSGRLSDRQAAIAAFKGLTPYADQLRRLLVRCRPYGRDYLAILIAKDSLETAAFHFTRVTAFYGAQGDSAGPVRAAF